MTKVVPRTAFRKGEKRPNQGKHGPPKITLELKAMILKALDNAGGVEYLTEQAKKKPAVFLQLIGRLIPINMNMSGNLNVDVREMTRMPDAELLALTKQDEARA